MPPTNAGTPDPTSNPTATPRRPIAPSGTHIAGRVGPPPIPSGPRDHGSGSGSGPGKPPGLAGTPDPGRLLQALRRRWVLALSLGLVVAGLLGAAAWNVLAPKHTAFSNVLISVNKETQWALTQDDRYSFNTFLKSQVGKIKSRFVLNAALDREEVKRLNLERKYGSRDKVLTWLDAELKIDSAADSELVRVMLSGDDADEALVLTRAISNAYLKEVVEREDAGRAARHSEYDKSYTQAVGKLRDQMASLQRQAGEFKSIDSEIIKAEHGNLVALLNANKTQYNTVRFELLRAQGRIEAHKAVEKSIVNQSIPESALNEVVEADPQLKLDLSRAQRWNETMEAMRAGLRYPEKEPQYVAVTEKLAATQKRIDTRRTELRKELEARARVRARGDYDAKLRQLEGEMTPLLVQGDSLGKEIDRLTKEIQKYATKIPELETGKQEIARQQGIVAELGKKLDVSRYELQAKPRVKIYDDAALMALERKKQFMGTGAGTMAGFGMAFMVVALWEFRRRRVHSTDEVSEGLGIRVVGAVPSSAWVEQLINAPAEEQDGDPLLTESIDAIRTQLLHASQSERMRLVMVTSAGAGEGKTTLASHLASSLARAGRKTLLIDGDLRQPAVHQLFEVTLQPGFSEVLLGEVETVDGILATNVDGLMVLPAGQWDRDVLASLARGGVQGVLEKLKDEFDFIVIDSHPVLSANDSLLIAQHVDAVILSVLREVSQTPKVYAAQQRLAGLGIRLLGAVVNGTDPDDVFIAPAAVGYTTTAA